MPKIKYKNQKDFWEYAGHIGYGKALFSNKTIERHITTRQWQFVMDTVKILGLNSNSKIIEFGCGDGGFTENVISSCFKCIDAYDKSNSAIQRARLKSKSSNISYHLEDLTTYVYETNAYWDGAFMIGFLHHVKDYVSPIISRLSRVCPRVIVLEPNGDNIIRKCLELFPSYKLAGEKSFHLKKIIEIFSDNGYKVKVIHRFSFTPPFLPERLFTFVKKLERFIESRSFLNKLCSTYVIGFQK
jgi:2-polyprenyl-3-methyl-5-hydroxy-6-metoxy-1,4-benzoquinol methylase